MKVRIRIHIWHRQIPDLQESLQARKTAFPRYRTSVTLRERQYNPHAHTVENNTVTKKLQRGTEILHCESHV